MTGVVPFVYLSTCGCVFSQAGLKAVSTRTPPFEKGKDKDQDQDKDKDQPASGEEGGAQLDVCPQCAKKFDRLEDVRILNPGPEEEERMRETMERRRASAPANNRGKSRKRKDAGGTPGGLEAVQPPGKKKKGGSGSGTASPAPTTTAPAASRAVASSLAMEEAKRKSQMSDAVKSLYHPKDGKVRKETFMTMGTFTRVSGKTNNYEIWKTDGIFKLIINSMRSCSGSGVSFLENTMMFPRKKPVNLTRHLTTTSPRSFSATLQRHVVPGSPTVRLLTQSHSPASTINSRVPSPPYSHPPVLLVHSRRPRSLPLPLQHILLRRHLPLSRMFFSSERLSTAWRHTPMKWNPLPWFVGALLLVVIQYRRYHSEKEVHVDEDGHEVIKLKGPWQVGVPLYSPPPTSTPFDLGHALQSPLARSTRDNSSPRAYSLHLRGFVDRTTTSFLHGPPN